MAVEKRRFPRVCVSFLVEYRGEKIWQHAQARDISRGGLFLVTNKIEPPGTKMEVIFEFGKETKRKLQAEGVVMWVRDKKQDNTNLPVGMGIEFRRLFPQDAVKYLDGIIDNWEK